MTGTGPADARAVAAGTARDQILRALAALLGEGRWAEATENAPDQAPDDAADFAKP